MSTENRDATYLEYLERVYAGRDPQYYDQFIGPIVPGPQDRILDWGCGLAGLLHRLRQRGCSSAYIGLDANRAVIQRNASRIPEGAFLHHPDDGTVPERERIGRVTRLFLLDVIEHTDRPMELLECCWNLLEPGGLLTLSTPDRLAFYKRGPRWRSIGFNLRRLAGLEWIDPTHRTEFTVGGLLRLIRSTSWRGSESTPSAWHRIPWIRPQGKHYSFILCLRKTQGA